MASEPRLLTLSGLAKAYAEPVLRDVHLDLRPGEVHALVGENGAGKTTLARIVAGLTPPQGGRMRLEGRPYAPATKLEAERHGVRLVMQELHLVPTLSVAENIFLQRLPHRLGVVDYPALHAQAAALMARMGLRGVEPRRPVGELGIGQQQLVEIAAGLSRRCRLLVLDEPTAALTDAEVELLFAQMRKLRDEGVGILYISHRLEEVQQIADRITVLRDGRVVGTRAAGEVSRDELIRLMVGRELGTIEPPQGKALGPVALRVEDLRRGQAVREVSFQVREGEVLGLAGLMGSGRTETLRAIFGADRRDGGRIYLGGSERPARIRSPREAVRQGIALLTEDRKEQGLLLPLAVRVNVSLARLRDVARLGAIVDAGRDRAAARAAARRLAIGCRSPDQPVAQLSGGNQQKVVVAKWLFRDSDVLLFDEPTRGIDVGAKFELYAVLADLAARGKAIVVASSDLLELLAICDRIAVMASGRLAATFRRGEWSQEKIMAAALGEERGGEARAAG
ncbi:MAG: sugar ABC transporter ATP-binding protein [Candidatus Brocadiia bacterium]